MKRKSIIYDIFTVNDVDFAEARKDFREIVNLVREEVMTAETSYKIRIDVGYYFCTPWGKIGLSTKPQLHILVEGKETWQIQQLLDSKLTDMQNFNLYDKHTFAEKVFTKHNNRLFACYSMATATMDVNAQKHKTEVTMSFSHTQLPKHNKLMESTV